MKAIVDLNDVAVNRSWNDFLDKLKDIIEFKGDKYIQDPTIVLLTSSTHFSVRYNGILNLLPHVLASQVTRMRRSNLGKLDINRLDIKFYVHNTRVDIPFDFVERLFALIYRIVAFPMLRSFLDQRSPSTVALQNVLSQYNCKIG